MSANRTQVVGLRPWYEAESGRLSLPRPALSTDGDALCGVRQCDRGFMQRPYSACDCPALPLPSVVPGLPIADDGVGTRMNRRLRRLSLSDMVPDVDQRWSPVRRYPLALQDVDRDVCLASAFH
jgi:hypothetical protein